MNNGSDAVSPLPALLYVAAGILFAASVVVLLIGGRPQPLVVEQPISVDTLVKALGDAGYQCDPPQSATRLGEETAVACREDRGHHPAVMTFGSRQTQDEAVAAIRGFRVYGADGHVAVGDRWAVNCGHVETCTQAAQAIVNAVGGQMITIPSAGDLPD